MQFWQALAFTHPDDLLELAPVCEEAGFEGIMLADHLFSPENTFPAIPTTTRGEAPFDGSTPFPESFATISALSQVTKTLRFLTNVYILPLRHPIEIAKDLSTAAIFSKNRTVLGFGAGWLREEFEIWACPSRSADKRMDEQIPIIQKLLAGEVVEARGEFYQFDALRMNPAADAEGAMWVGGMNKAALGARPSSEMAGPERALPSRRRENPERAAHAPRSLRTRERALRLPDPADRGAAARTDAKLSRWA